jgi:hypothetical protein
MLSLNAISVRSHLLDLLRLKYRFIHKFFVLTLILIVLCHTMLWGQNQMHIICGPGSIFPTYVDITSVIYQKTMQ